MTATTETKHTPEPWFIVGNEHAHTLVSGGVVIADVFTPDDNTVSPASEEEAEANARRIVACVNACAAISDNELTHGPVIALNKFSFVVNEREETRKQRDALAAALREYTERHEAECDPSGLPEYDKAQKALASLT